MREREGKSGGGKGFLLSEEKAFTLATGNFHTVFVFEGRYDEAIRIYEDGITPTIRSAYGTGGGNVPYVYEPKSAFEENWAESQVKNALRAEASKSSHAVVYPIQGTVIGRSDNAGPQGKGYGEDGYPMFTLTKTDQHAIAVDTYNQTLSSTNQTLRKGNAGIDHMGGVMEASTVRRLTPTECERLQGFPDGWTDGQADSHRYKQMGNAVAVPVVEWIIGRMTGVSDEIRLR